jgi:hypothetical protein
VIQKGDGYSYQYGSKPQDDPQEQPQQTSNIELNGNSVSSSTQKWEYPRWRIDSLPKLSKIGWFFETLTQT